MLPALTPGAPLDVRALEAWLDPIAPIAKLAATPYGDADGDVWTRTRLALQALVDGVVYASQPPASRHILATATALHAIGKLGAMPGTPGHASKGDTMARAALWRSDVPFAVREHVCALIRHHRVPMWGLGATDPARLARRISLVTRHDWLVAIALGNVHGGFIADAAESSRLSDNCALWLEHCRELSITARPQPFTTAHTKVVYFESPSRQPDVDAYDDTTCEVIVMCGLPASGKNTWLATNYPDLPVVSLDDLRAELDVDPAGGQGEVIDAARERAREHLRTSTPFAWNATNLTRVHRAQIIELIRSYRGRARIVYCETTAAERHRRNTSRAAVVPAQAMARMIQRWTVPDPSEAHDITYVVPADGDETWPPC